MSAHSPLVVQTLVSVLKALGSVLSLVSEANAVNATVNVNMGVGMAVFEV